MNLKITTAIFAFTLFVSFFTSCDKDPEIITETVVETDTVFVTAIDTVFLTITDTITLTQLIDDTATTFILVRHAETTGAGGDPILSAAGQERADELTRVLGDISLDAVYSTNFNRTMLTAQPTAGDQGITIQNYGGFDLDPLTDEILGNYQDGAILVVGHSNTTPSLLNVITGTNVYSQLPETQYDNLYLVTVYEKGRAKVLHLKYGEPTP